MAIPLFDECVIYTIYTSRLGDGAKRHVGNRQQNVRGHTKSVKGLMDGIHKDLIFDARAARENRKERREALVKIHLII